MILFLDFDGVLHPESVYRVDGRPTLRGPGVLFEHAQALVDILAPHPDLEIVLSTSWVSVLGYDRTRAWLHPELDRRVVGATYHNHAKTWWHEVTRYQQITRYVRLKQPEHWVAIDDDAYGWPDVMKDYLVRTHPTRGLGDEDAQALLCQRLAD